MSVKSKQSGPDDSPYLEDHFKSSSAGISHTSYHLVGASLYYKLAGVSLLIDFMQGFSVRVTLTSHIDCSPSVTKSGFCSIDLAIAEDFTTH